MISELVDVSSRLLAKLTPALDDLQGRVGVERRLPSTMCIPFACVRLGREGAHDGDFAAGRIDPPASSQEPGEARARRRGSCGTGLGSVPHRRAASGTASGRASPPRRRRGRQNPRCDSSRSWEKSLRASPSERTSRAANICRCQPDSSVGRDAFAARVRGDSMTGDGVFAGDYVILVPDPEPEDGQMVVVLRRCRRRRRRTGESEAATVRRRDRHSPGVVRAGRTPSTAGTRGPASRLPGNWSCEVGH